MPQPKIFEEAMLLRMPRGTMAKLRAAAGKYGQTVSEYVRQLVRRNVEKDAPQQRG